MPGCEYRDRAVECWRLARETTVPELRATLIAMAQAWMLLHEQAERNARTDIVYETPERPPVVQQRQQQLHRPPVVQQQQQQPQPDEQPQPPQQPPAPDKPV